MTVIVAGADGCRGGWICVLRRLDVPLQEQVFIAKTFDGLIAHPAAPAIIAIDIPIGIPAFLQGAGRACDVGARSILKKRGASVFAVPARAAVEKDDYREACAAAMAHSDPPRQISRQTFNLFPKIREVDAVMTPDLQQRVFECHPELAFFVMSGGASPEPKKLRGKQNERGLDERRALLESQGFAPEFLRSKIFPASVAGADDFLDACACAWTAARLAMGKALRIPNDPSHDPNGIRMEICA